MSAQTVKKERRTSLHKELLDELSNARKHILHDFICQKLSNEGHPTPPGLADALAEHILQNGDEPFQWDDGKTEVSPIDIEFTEEDVDTLVEKIDDFVEHLPEALDEMAEASASVVLRSLKRDWPQQAAWQKATMDGFVQRLHDTWGDGFQLLRMLTTISAELGAEAHVRWRRSRSHKKLALREVLLRLHARACQITREIQTLLEAGFADGAMARWRTLYEIHVVATVIVEGGEKLAERYLDHEAVESMRALQNYEAAYEDLGYRPYPKRQKQRIIKRYQEAEEKYGRLFCRPNGWAAHHLNKNKVRFSDLEHAAQSSSMRPYYKMASYNVHADIKGIYHRLGTIDDEDILIAGASNAGLVDPAQNTAITLVKITALLLNERIHRLDEIVQLKILLRLQNQAVKAFVKADRALKRECK